MRAVRKHTDCKWVRLYIERWLEAPVQLEDGSLIHREKGTPQGGGISPLLANLFLHYAFDKWMQEGYFLRSLLSGMRMMGFATVEVKPHEEVFGRRLSSGLLNVDWNFIGRRRELSTASSDRRQKDYPERKFDFLGYTFRPRGAKVREDRLFCRFQSSRQR